jgi:hypothetical protein
MKIQGYEITSNRISEIEERLRKVDAFDHSALESELIRFGVPEYIGIKFIAYQASSRILGLWNKQKKIKYFTDNHGGYWKWK